MLKLLNYFLNGLVYIVLSPFIVAYIAFRFVVTFLIYIGGEIISLFSFLGGKKYRNVDELSIKAEKMLDESVNNMVRPQMQSNIDFNYPNNNQYNPATNTVSQSNNNNEKMTVNTTSINLDAFQQVRRGDHV
jgi:hypothetical protein